MKTESVKIDSIHPDPANVRLHSERNLEVIKGSLLRFGQQTPLVVDGDGVIRKGNGTYAAAKALGWDKINIVRTTLKGAEATAYAIADNRSGDPEVGSLWDNAALAETLESLKLDESIDELVTGFDGDEISKIIQGYGSQEELQRTAEDSVELKDVPIRKPPKMAWVLIGISTTQFGDINADVERIASLPNTIVETTVNDG